MGNAVGDILYGHTNPTIKINIRIFSLGMRLIASVGAMNSLNFLSTC
eukprot:COSAG01_NODE_45222_length_411_cov_1.000000_1_plen_46_part_10